MYSPTVGSSLRGIAGQRPNGEYMPRHHLKNGEGHTMMMDLSVCWMLPSSFWCFFSSSLFLSSWKFFIFSFFFNQNVVRWPPESHSFVGPGQAFRRRGPHTLHSKVAKLQVRPPLQWNSIRIAWTKRLESWSWRRRCPHTHPHIRKGNLGPGSGAFLILMPESGAFLFKLLFVLFSS